MSGKSMRLATDERHDVTRVEAFSDGVFAIAITLLVLNIHIPTAEEFARGGLAGALLGQWPVYPTFRTPEYVLFAIFSDHYKPRPFLALELLRRDQM